MTKEELKNKYSAFITEISEILGLGKPIDILKLCAATDRFFTPLRKQIQIDAEQIRALQKQNGELTDELIKKSDTSHQLVEQLAKLNERCSELEAQIEKMRNCANCKNYNGNEGFCVLGSGYGYNCNLEKWEIKEK